MCRYSTRLFNLIVFFLYAGRATCDYYTSVSGLQILLDAEGRLLDSLSDLMSSGIKDEPIARALINIKDEHMFAKNDSFAYLSNPISAFKLLKRFVVDWTIVEDYIKDLSDSISHIIKEKLEPPTEDDLKGAALGLVRLQETYKLNISELADGKIYGKKYSSPMSASDCLELGLSLYEAKEYSRALPWLQEAIAKTQKLDQTDEIREQLDDVMKFLAATYFYLGNSDMAHLITNEILDIDPMNADALENKKIYETTAFEERNSRKLHRKPLGSLTKKQPTVQELSDMTCRGERRQTPTEQRPLRCMFITNGKPYRFIGPFKMEQLSLDPLVVYYHQVISEGDIQRAIQKAEPLIERSKIGDLGSDFSEFRTSKTAWLFNENETFLGDIHNTLTDMTDLSLKTAEALQVVNYGIGGHYGHHWDFSLEPIEAYGEWRGNRIATALFYINNVELGGATAFPFLKLAVQPVKGSLVFWFNLHTSLEPDFRMKHVGCPVLKGSKWILNEWFHEREQEFNKPCGLQDDAHISKPFRFMA